MARMTISVPEKLKKEMDEFPEMHWATVIRNEFMKKVEELKKLDEKKRKNQ